MGSLKSCRGSRRVLVACLTCCLLGCGRPSGPATHAVSGTVSLDGKPLATGDVIFYAKTENIPAVMGKLVEGHYAFRAAAGQHSVSIQSVGGKPRAVTAGMPPVSKPIVPARYNQATTLTADVIATGTNRFDFDLTSDSPSDK